MPEANVNVEIAEHLRTHGPGHRSERREEIVEILEAVLLAVVAVATAWSGYQAAKWDGVSTREYSTSTRLRVESEQASINGNQVLAYNAGTFNSWLQARTSGDQELATLLVDRFTPEYRIAFDAWLKTKPFTNPDAPPGPGFMPEFEDPYAEKSETLADEATEAYEQGVHARETGEKYVRLTVVLAAVLFLIAVGQRFKIRNVRVAVITVAGVFLVYGVVLGLSLPRA